LPRIPGFTTSQREEDSILQRDFLAKTIGTRGAK
jgi:hypothetical protein